MTSYRAPANSIIPAIFIGMGGTGSRIVDRIAQRASLLPHWEAQLQNLMNFVVVDTNSRDLKELSDCIPQRNRINIAAFDKRRAVDDFRQSRNKQALEWLPPDYQPREGTKPGAGQIRIESRLGFFFQSPVIRSQLTEIVKDSLDQRWSNDRMINRTGGANPYHVYLFCSLAGGTGSGSFLSMAYLTTDIIRAQSHEPRVVGNLLLSSLLTGVVEQVLWPNIHANTYAALKELEHLTKLDYQQIRDEGRSEEHFQYWHDPLNNSNLMRVRSRPFFMSLIYDQPGAHSVTNHEDAIADTAFLQLFTPIMGKLEGELDNFETWMNALTIYPGRKIGRGYSKFFGSVGAAVLSLPAEELLRYCSLRFASHAIRQQITFGLSSERREDDERTRRLQRHAIDYTDTKFLNMDASQRNRLINSAFVKSVAELATIDEEDDQPTSYWASLVDRTEKGTKVIGPDGRVISDDDGNPKRNPSTLHEVGEGIAADRKKLMSHIDIKVPGFLFSWETVNQYDSLVDRLADQARQAEIFIQETQDALVGKANSGVYIDALRLDPIQERYIVLRMLTICESEWLTTVNSDLEKWSAMEISASSSQRLLREELSQQLRDVATPRMFGFPPNVDSFNLVRDEARKKFQEIAIATKRYFEARIARAQLTALRGYLLKRSEQYAQLSQRMERLVRELEGEAAQLRTGKGWRVPPHTLRVEVFQKLEGGGDAGSRERMWDEVYHRLFIAGGRFLSTFDRDALSQTIKEQLKDEVLPDGRTASKSPERIVRDVRAALIVLGSETLRPKLFGEPGEDDVGIDVLAGMELEAKIVLGGEPDAEDLLGYVRRKIRALGSLAGVLARVDSAGRGASGDGVKPSRTRRIVLGRPPGVSSAGEDRLAGLLKRELGQEGRKLEILSGRSGTHDQHSIIVHDVELGIPLYYIPAIVREIEPAYLQLQNHPRREFKLHTKEDWEKGLPNLDPGKGDIAIDWTLRTMARALTAKLINVEEMRWVYRDDHFVMELGDHLTQALYKLESLYSKKNFGQSMMEALEKRERESSPEKMRERSDGLKSYFKQILQYLDLLDVGIQRGGDPEQVRQQLLDRPALEALIEALERAAPPEPKPDAVQLPPWMRGTSDL